MKLTGQRALNAMILFCCGAMLFLSLGINQLAQTTQKLPPRTGHINDFASVVNERTRQQLENVLSNLKLKTGIEFDVVTVQSTEGQDISDFSLQIARDWNIATRTSLKKSLLLVVAVDEKLSFTRFSKSVQIDLPEGVLGELGQRMRPLIDAGRFSEGLSAGVQHFVSSLAQKLAFNAEELDNAPAVSQPSPVVTEKTEISSTEVPLPIVSTSPTSEVVAKPIRNSAPRKENPTAKIKKSIRPVDDEAESEEVELTLTKPVEERVNLLKAFLETHPDSKSRARAIEILVSARAAVGDQRLMKGDSASGVEQFMLAIADAPLDASDKLFSGVIYQIPMNLYVRGQAEAATKAAREIEAKFGNDPRRLVMLSSFYVTTEQAGEALRLARQAMQVAPDLAEAHEGVARALHISLRLDEAAAEYKKALELDPNLKTARRSLADLDRALGKPEEALALYRQQLEADSANKPARAGLVLSLLDLGRKDEAKAELDKALAADPRNLSLLAGAAYWFAAHNDSERALDLAQRAVEIEPRYTWSQIALARALVAQRKPLDAERALRFARQYGKFPTLDYELASTLVAAGLYDEAAEVLMQSFRIKDGQIETRLAGQSVVRGADFVELLAPERRASIFQFTAADSENNARLLKALLTFAAAIDPGAGTEAISEEAAITAAKTFAAGDDDARVHRELYVANRLLEKGLGFQTAYELAEEARDSAAAGMTVPELTIVVQADEFRSIRAQAIAAGGTPDIPEAPRNVLSNLLRGRIEDTSGWALYNQEKYDAAADHLKRAVAVLPEGTPAARTALWHLGAILERQGNKSEALSNYIKSYNFGDPDPVRRALIEQLYRKVNGSLEGLDERIGPGFPTPADSSATVEKTGETVQPGSSPQSTPAATPETSSAQPSTVELSPSTKEPATDPSPTPSAEVPAASIPEATPTQSPEPTPQPTPVPSPEALPASSTPEPTPAATPEATPATIATSSLQTSPVEKLNKPPQTTVTLTGRVKDSTGSPLGNVIIVLISPLGMVLTSTTDEQGTYSFTIAAATAPRSYRLIPSKDGFAFEPVDRVLPIMNEDVKDLDFVGAPQNKP